MRGGQPVERRDAINDVVIHKWGTARLITLDTYVDGDFVHSQRSDASSSPPHGSTAYALSCGDPSCTGARCAGDRAAVPSQLE